MGSALHLATEVRLRIFGHETVAPLARAHLERFGQRLVEVGARRHAVDFELAKAVRYWQSVRVPDLVAQALKMLVADSEVARLLDESGMERVVFEREAGELTRAEIDRHFLPLKLELTELRDARLNVQ